MLSHNSQKSKLQTNTSTDPTLIIMKLIVPSLVALAMAVEPVSAAYLRTAQAQTNLVDKSLGVEQGEVYVEIDNTIGDLDAKCRLVFMNAFNDSYDQIYGIDGGMSVFIESEEVIPADVKNLAAPPRVGYLWKTYYVS